MKNTVNKKAFSLGGIGIILITALMLSLALGLNGCKAPKQTVEGDETADVSGEAVVETADITEEAVDQTEELPADTSDDTTEAPVTQDTTEADVTTNVTNPGGTVITGAGSASEPYLEIPNEDMTVTTVSIPARSELYYDIYRVGGMYLTVNDPDAYIICDNLQYDAVNGQIYMQVPNALASDSISFRVGNYSNTAKSFTLIFTSPLGSYQNPAVVDGLSEGFNVSLEEGNETGFYFKHYATQNGVIRFYMQASVDSIFIVTNNRNSAQRTSDSDAATDANGNEYVEIEVNQGDELLINVGAMPNKRGKYPAVEIYWNGIYN
ncbi:MAG: hypothetical protein IKT46_04915 [Clostridia bacterium]|nr:hypothetical protein [Clostridia bacterium]